MLQPQRQIPEAKTLESVMFQSMKDWNDIFYSLTDLVTIHDLDFNIIHANAEAKKILHLPPLTVKRVKCFHYYHGTSCPPDGCPSCETIRTGQASTVELFEPHLGKHIEIRALPRFGPRRQMKGVIHIVRDISQRKESEERLRKSREKLRNLTAHLHSVREEERKHIAREIHDELAQALTALKMDVFWMKKRLPDDNGVLLQKAQTMSGLIDTTIQSVQRIASELRPGLLDDLGLQEAVQWHTREFQDRTGIRCELAFEGEWEGLDPDRSITIFRVFQEALTNVARHAEATSVEMSCQATDRCVKIRIRDDGRGISREESADPKSFGIIGIRERVHYWGGSVSIQGAPGEGTTIKVSIPRD